MSLSAQRIVLALHRVAIRPLDADELNGTVPLTRVHFASPTGSKRNLFILLCSLIDQLLSLLCLLLCALMPSYKQSDYEALRRRCVELHQAGWKQLAIAQAFGLTQPWVRRTLKKYQQQGATALQESKRTGAPARLSAEQLSQLVAEFNKGAKQHSFSGAIWTRLRVNQVIKKLFGVSYDPSQVGRILKKMGWSRQKPQRKARQQDGQAVARWRDEHLSELKRSQA